MNQERMRKRVAEVLDYVRELEAGRPKTCPICEEKSQGILELKKELRKEHGCE